MTASRVCPQCAHLLDRETATYAVNPVDPKPGDLTVCIHCAVALVFTDELGLRFLEFVEYIGLGADEREQLSAVTTAVRLSKFYFPGPERLQ